MHSLYVAAASSFLSPGSFAFFFCANHRSISNRNRPLTASSVLPLFNSEQKVVADLSTQQFSEDENDEEVEVVQIQRHESSKPLWMKCINAVVPPNVRALNEAVAIVANVTREEANELIDIGAVWAKMDLLNEDDVMSQYYEENPSSASIQYADLPSGWGSGEEAYNEEEMSLDEYVERQMSLRYRRILTPSTIDPGTDVRVYPHPRRFPACYEFADRSRLLYEDTTFIVVDKHNFYCG